MENKENENGINKGLREEISSINENALVFDNPSFDTAIIGMSHDDRVIYDYNLMVEELMKKDGIPFEEAAEFIDYNTLRSIPYFGENAPIVMTTLDPLGEFRLESE